MLHQKSLQLQYEGFLKTPVLWFEKEIKELEQFKIINKQTTTFTTTIDKNPRLGKLVERFVSHQLKELANITILTENRQIQDDKTTIGELDCLLLNNNSAIHLEIVYKFYLYDGTVGCNPIDHWIGPNRRDSFSKKIDKLKNKQLPLLYHPKTKDLLQKYNLEKTNIKQQVYFKAQLFVPHHMLGNQFRLINNECIKGFYIPYKDINMFNDCKFYIPRKHDWLVIPHPNVDWLGFNTFQIKIFNFISEKSVPLCWLKKNNGELFKLFVVWW